MTTSPNPSGRGGKRGTPTPPGVQPDMFTSPDDAPKLPVGAPLAARMRPRNLDEFVGQLEVVGPTSPLRRMIDADDLTSIILWGPPGAGKTTLASIVAHHTKRYFAELSAVSSGVAEVRKLIEEARDRERISGRRTILFIDELHRFNRAQQDALLPHVEAGTVTLIGATTENPSFYVVAPLLSRCRTFRLELLQPEDLITIVDHALQDTDRGLGGHHIDLEPDARHAIPALAAGDARTALNLVEMAARITPPEDPTPDGAAPNSARRIVTRTILESVAQHPTMLYDRMGDAHYDTISAFIKTVRDSDPDGALYWLARMLEAGEDPLFVARRLVILAAEDIGLADPHALTLAVSCQQASHFLGMPEARLPLAETTIYLARAPKSNSAYAAYNRAQADAQQSRNEAVPIHLRNAATGLMKDLGYGQGYQYPHDNDSHLAPDQHHRPPSVEGNTYYTPGTLGAEPHPSPDPP
ncbi:MAG: replication-associated recombination protein A, partial [Dehalococcoidia bacterium]|nr:replication-associated recombination protein A [Dehalococcoidia bacterium]